MPYDDAHERHRRLPDGHPDADPDYPPHRPRRAPGGGGGIPDGLLVGVLAFLLGLTVFVWTATGLAGLLAHGAWPDGVSFARTPLAVRQLVTEPHDIEGAWPATPGGQLSGYGLFWGLFVSQILVLMVLTVFVMGTVARARAVRRARRIRDDRRRAAAEAASSPGAPAAPEAPASPGTPERRHPDTTAGHPGAAVPAPKHPGPLEDPAHRLPYSAPGPESGSEAGAGSWPKERSLPPGEASTPAADRTPPSAEPGAPATVLSASTGPGIPAHGARQGPEHPGSALPAPGGTPAEEDPVTRILEAPGAVLVSAGTPELWNATRTARAKLGPVHVFDPTHACDTPDRLRWSPHHGCADRATAASRATALLAPLRSPRPIDATTHTTAETLLRCWLHAAALEKRSFREVHRWALATGQTADAVRVLRSHPRAASGTAGELESALAGHPQLRADALALIRRALSPLGQLHVRNACSAERADRLALESFVAEAGTLYVVGEDPDVLPILNALTESVVEHGRRMAARSSDGRLDPPLTSVLELPATPF
ncbi:hypothetical protein ACFYMO_28650 [Streptomyces sp. NPDC007025]|uniref:hypothetical protein n=1 Tax=Streptomyces sp. NPDC007025 TaxID=3364771 RepID=UPI0036B3748E